MAAEQVITPMDWDLVARNVSGELKKAAEAAERAHTNFVAPIRQYKVALEDVTYQAQLCAR
jgi:hypothetical protein